MKKVIFISVLCIFSIHGFSQNNFYIGFDAARSYDKYDVFDTGNGAYLPELKSSSWSGILGYTISNNIKIESGLIWKLYREGSGIKTSNDLTYSLALGYYTWQVPIRINASIPIYKDKISIITRAGYHLCKNTDPQRTSLEMGSATYESSPENNYSYTIASNVTNDKYFNLLETGIGLEFKLSEKMQLITMASYYAGFKPLITKDLKYTIGNNSEQNASIVSKGNYLNYSLGLRFDLTK